MGGFCEVYLDAQLGPGENIALSPAGKLVSGW